MLSTSVNPLQSRLVRLLMAVNLVLMVLYFFKSPNQSRSLKPRPASVTDSNRLPHQIHWILEQAYFLDVQLFLVEPRFLIRIINDTDKQTIERNGLFPNVNNMTTDRIFSFGIFAEEAEKFELEVLPMIGSHFNQTSTKSNQVKENPSLFSPIEYEDVPLHYVSTTDKLVTLHVVVFHDRGLSFWTGKLEDVTYGRAFFGRDERLFDKFELTKATIGSTELLVPNEVGHFIVQLETSRYITCDKNTSNWFHDKYPNITDDYRHNDKVKYAIRHMKSLMKSKFIPFFMMAGTLLGWYRQCSLIPYTKDVDFSTWSRFASHDFTRELIKLRTRNFGLRFIYGLPHNGYEYTFVSKHWIRLDLFYLYQETGYYSNYYTCSAHYPLKGFFLRYYYPKFELCSTDLMGMKLLVPCDPKLVIESEYGPDWYYPKNTLYTLENSKAYLNSGPIVYWKDKEKPKIYFDLNAGDAAKKLMEDDFYNSTF